MAFTIGMVAAAAITLAVTLGLVFWSSSLRRAYEGPDAVTFARSPIFFIIFGVGTALALAVAGIFSSNTNILAWGIVLAFCGVIFALFYLAPTFRFYVSDARGLTSQWLLAKKTLPWPEIDWIYSSRQVVTNRAYGIPVSKSTRDWLVVSAAARQSIVVPISDTYLYLKGAPRSFTRTIEQRATNALVGYDKAALVKQRRAVGALPR